jgi:DNA mismatch repair protein MutL
MNTSLAQQKIIKLSQLVCDRIAAGEVIERPASVVRELIDNSIDAEASSISVRVVDGGRASIEVVDDGCGMNKADAMICFDRHTTSKISKLEDIYHITSMGFRGEALASIASVSLFEIETKDRDSDLESGVYLQLENGNVVSTKPMNRTPGTTMRVLNLFYNVPVRMRFLKNPSYEFRQIKRDFILKSLPFPDRSFELQHNGKQILYSRSSQSFLTRIKDYYTEDLVTALVPIEKQSVYQDWVISLHGYITNPTFTLNHKRDYYFFVNGRPISSPNLIHAVTQGYEHLIPSNGFPAVFLFLTIPPNFLDVNIHPTKREIKFFNESFIHGFLVKAIRETFGEPQTHIPAVEIQGDETTNHKENETQHLESREPTTESLPSGSPSPPHSPQSSLPQNTHGVHNEPLASEVDSPSSNKPNHTEIDLTQLPRGSSAFDQSNTIYSIPGYEHLRLVGTMFHTYILLEAPDCMVLVDQHAAHERVNFEQIKKQMEAQELTIQKLLIPSLIHVNRMEETLIEDNQETFRRLGIELEQFGDGSFLVHSVPDFVPRNKEKQAITEIINRLTEMGEIKPTTILDQLLKTQACHASIRGGDPQSREEISELMRLLFEYTNPFTCPHGRPIAIRIKKNELEKHFKRLG